MTTYEGSCHCGAVRFRAHSDNRQIVVCNCSICTKKGTRHLRVGSEQFTLLSGRDSLIKYQFASHVASHFFCKHCGIHPYAHPRSAPDMVSINIQCLDTPRLEDCDFEVIAFDGQHWEEAAAKLNQKLALQTI